MLGLHKYAFATVWQVGKSSMIMGLYLPHGRALAEFDNYLTRDEPSVI
jgi:hypothetical protein